MSRDLEVALIDFLKTLTELMRQEMEKEAGLTAHRR